MAGARVPLRRLSRRAVGNLASSLLLDHLRLVWYPVHVSTTATEFAQIARAVSSACGRLQLKAPGYRTPPRTLGRDRTIRRLPGGVIVAVRCTGRSVTEVAGDLIEGTLVANECIDDDARAELWVAVLEAVQP